MSMSAASANPGFAGRGNPDIRFAGRGNPDIRTMIGLFICPPLWLSICFSGYSLSCFSGYSLSAISLLHHLYVPDVPRLSVGFQGLFP